MSKIYKRTSFSFSNEKFMLGCLEDKHFLNLSAGLREENNTNISSTEDRLQTMRAIFESIILKIAHKNIN